MGKGIQTDDGVRLDELDVRIRLHVREKCVRAHPAGAPAPQSAPTNRLDFGGIRFGGRACFLEAARRRAKAYEDLALDRLVTVDGHGSPLARVDLSGQINRR